MYPLQSGAEYTIITFVSGRGAVGSALDWGQEVAGSNPVAPTIKAFNHGVFRTVVFLFEHPYHKKYII